MMEPNIIKLCDIAFISYVYSHTTEYDKSFRELQEVTKNSIDLKNPNHRMELLKWLNNWGCRQFSKKYHQYASKNILQWYEKQGNGIIPENKSLLDINSDDMDKICILYDSLSSTLASLRNDYIEVKIGPTGAAKLLFALRPNTLPPWDDPIRSELQYNDTGQSYCEYVNFIMLQQRSLVKECNQYGFSGDEFFIKIGRPNVTWIKLIDEYCWMVYTGEFELPKSDIIRFWLKIR